MLAKRKISYVFKDRNVFIKYNPLSLVFGGALYFYQAAISPQIMQGCIFSPSCSNFSKQCIHRFGIIKGIALSTDRLTRCTRLAAIDCHPVMFNINGTINDYPEFYTLRKEP
jgi:putative component of membrane protein insertase Oxa1/YidC/SpoIIIJ protein YidD